MSIDYAYDTYKNRGKPIHFCVTHFSEFHVPLYLVYIYTNKQTKEKIRLKRNERCGWNRTQIILSVHKYYVISGTSTNDISVLEIFGMFSIGNVDVSHVKMGGLILTFPRIRVKFGFIVIWIFIPFQKNFRITLRLSDQITLYTICHMICLVNDMQRDFTRTLSAI